MDTQDLLYWSDYAQYLDVCLSRNDMMYTHLVSTNTRYHQVLSVRNTVNSFNW